MTEPAEPILRVRNISKRFAGVVALGDVSLSFLPGQVHAVIGENGAGKSTLMKILAGVQPPDDGSVWLDGQQVNLDSVSQALDLGIALIHQELNLADNLTVAANILLGREPRTWGWMNRREIRKRAQSCLDMVGLNVSPDDLVGDLPIGTRQLIEIAKALSVDARVLIMDEPTSSLTQAESERLFQVIGQLRERGVTIIYVSHRLSEIVRLADEVSVLRDGEFAGGIQKQNITHDAMVQLMVGRDISQYYSRHSLQPGEVMLSASKLETSAWPGLHNSFEVRAGEMVCIAGLVGAGRTELLETLFGIRPALSGSVTVKSKPVPVGDNAAAIRAGVSLVPEDRKASGLVLEMGSLGNISLPNLRRHSIGNLFVNRRMHIRDCEEMTQKMSIKTPGPRQPVKFLSGGNQQKVVIGKWLSMRPGVLLLDEPTRGVDIGAKQQIYQLMEQLAGEGVAILFVSSELEEVLSMADRVLVMHEGRITGELDKSELSEASIMQLATGGKEISSGNLATSQ